MKDECTAFEPIVDTLQMLSISSLEILKNMVEKELEDRRKMFYNAETKNVVTAKLFQLRSVK